MKTVRQIRKLTPDEIANFKSELKALLTKYDVNLQFTCDSGSDTYGLTGEAMTVCQNYQDKELIRVNGWSLSSWDIN